MIPLKTILADRKKFYRVYPKRKPNGKKRWITEPLDGIIEWQYLVKKWLDTFPLHDAAHGFREGRSIITNAMQHRDKKFVLNIDLKDFFPSITSFAVYQMLRGVAEETWKTLSQELQEAVAEEASHPTIACGDPIPAELWDPAAREIVTSLCTLNSRLPQGTCTSPVLANIIAKPMDYELHRLATSQGLTYTRYADDMTFSGDEIPKWFIGRVREIAESFGFKINTRKTKLIPYYQRQVVTGVVVNNETLSVSKKRRNALREHLYKLGKMGQEIDESSAGVLGYIRDVNETQHESLIRSYHEGQKSREAERSEDV